MKLPELDIKQLRNSLTYLHVSELKDWCQALKLSSKGKKIILIARIEHFVKTGQKTELLNYPTQSRARKSQKNDLHPSAVMFKGLYKNDLKTRLFFKQIIGEHFHFTAFGIDWLEECWMEGKPPTYQEFADMWQKEYSLRQIHGSKAKEEWAYINFVQQYLINNPNTSSSEILRQWEQERNKNKVLVHQILAQIKK